MISEQSTRKSGRIFLEMTSLKEWVDIKIRGGGIHYFEYKNFRNIEKIGEGGFGIVNKADYGEIKAALKSLPNNSTINEDQKENFLKELKLLHQVSLDTHPNINQFLGATKDLHNNYIIVLRYANQGNLREYLEINFHLLHWKDKIQMALDITGGLKYLHSKQIIHRDLHAKNILVNNGSLMIADFGLSKPLADIKSDSTVLGMLAYIDPQCYINSKYKRNAKSDIYSFGGLLWEISSGKPPFSEISISDIIKGIRESPVNNTPVQYHQLYENCWKEEPNQRPDIDEAHRVLNQLKLQFDNDEQVKILTSRRFSDLNYNNSNSSMITSYSDSNLKSLSLPQNNNQNDTQLTNTLKEMITKLIMAGLFIYVSYVIINSY